MTKAELLKKLKELHASSDSEAAHVKADKLIIEYIDDKKVQEAFEKVPKWYA